MSNSSLAFAFDPPSPPLVVTAAKAMALQLAAGSALSRSDINRIMTDHFGGTDALGAWSVRDAHAALELAQIHYFQGSEHISLSTPIEEADQFFCGLDARVPTQTNRSDEQIEWQQFATPPRLAWLAARACGLMPNELVLEPSTASRVEVEQGVLDTWLGFPLRRGFCVALGARDGERLVLGRTVDEPSARFVAAQLAARHTGRGEEVRAVSLGELFGALPPRIRVQGDVASAGSAPWMLEIGSSRRGLVAAFFAVVFCALVGGGLVSLPWTMHLRPGDDPFEGYGLFLPLGLAFFAGALAAAHEFVTVAFGTTRVVLGPEGIDTITVPLGPSAWRPAPRWRHGEVKARAVREPGLPPVRVVMEDGRDLVAGLALDLTEAEHVWAVIARYYT